MSHYSVRQFRLGSEHDAPMFSKTVIMPNQQKHGELIISGFLILQDLALKIEAVSLIYFKL